MKGEGQKRSVPGEGGRGAGQLPRGDRGPDMLGQGPKEGAGRDYPGAGLRFYRMSAKGPGGPPWTRELFPAY